MPDISKVILLDNTEYNLRDTRAAIATDSTTGTVKPDGTSITIDANGTLTAQPEGMVILSYGSSTWNDFISAYENSRVVYCRASSNSNPASGSQTRLAFMAYVNNATTPTNVEFQYYRSMSAHTVTQQGDQVYVYKLDKNSGWSVTVREASAKIVAGTGLSQAYRNDTLTLSLDGSIPSASTTAPSMDGTASYGSSDDYARADHVHPTDTSRQATLVSGTNIKTVNSTSLLGSGDVAVQPTLVSGTNIKTINNESILGSGNLDIGGGGAEITVTSVAIAVADWSNNTCTKSVTWITASNSVIVTYAPESKDVYTAANVYCSGQGAGMLTFSCDTVPTDAVTANVMIVDGAVTPVPKHNLSGNTTFYKTCTQNTYYELSDPITEAEEGETVYIGVPSGYRISSSPSVTFTSIGITTYGGAYSFVMPTSNITVTLSDR